MEDDEVASSRVGKVLREKWTLEKLVGVGGMAAVYVARHKIGRLDAIKILHPEYARSEQVRARFEQEAHVLNKFKHPGAVEVRDLERTDDGAPFIVMELLEGQSLATVIRERTPTVDETLRMADEVLDVLAAAHAQGIIHRDIKPDNLFVLPNGSIKVLDFGIAQLRGDERQLKTKTGTTLGTVAYMPSEQLKGIDIDARADVYGVGATMFRMLTGKTPHAAGSDVELMMKVLTDPAPRIASVMKAVRADVARIVDRALAFDRDARYPNARAMQGDVRAARDLKDAPMAEPIIAPPPGSEAPTRTPANIAVPVAPISVPVIAPTMHAAPESALLRESVPQSRAVTSVVPVSQPVSQPNIPKTDEEEKKKNEIAGIPILWLVIGGAITALGLVGVVAMVAIALLRGHPDTAPSATATTAAPTVAYPAQPAATPTEEEEEEHHPPPPPGKGHGHGKHKP
jgi:serine/threonine-protein kinase